MIHFLFPLVIMQKVGIIHPMMVDFRSHVHHHFSRLAGWSERGSG
jgi:hypothetical protein